MKPEQAHPESLSHSRIHTLGARIFSSHLFAIALAIALVSFALTSLFRNYFLDALEDSLQVQADLIARSILPEVDTLSTEAEMTAPFNTLQQQQIDQLSVQVENRAAPSEQESLTEALTALRQANIAVSASLQTGVYIFDRDQKVILSPVTPGPDPQLFNSMVKSALEGQKARDILPINEERHLVVSAPLMVDEQIIAAMVLNHPLTDLEAVFQNLWLRLGIAGVISLLVTGVLSLIFARNLQTPLTQLREASEHLRQGDFEHPVPTGRLDELGELSRTFDAMRVQLKSTEQLRTRFLSDAAHELRTPLTSIKGLIETLRDGAVEDIQVRDRFLASIERETDRLIRLTRDLLVLTRADIDGFTPQRDEIDFVELIEQVVLQFEIEAQRKSVNFEVTGTLGDITLLGDRDRLRQVLINLIDNALRHAPQGSKIQVELKQISWAELPDKCVESLQIENEKSSHLLHWLVVSIRDQGPGIPLSEHDRVFDRFYRVEQARDRQRGGSGLGLPIARAIVAAHGGCIWIQSPITSPRVDRPVGTEVIFCLPLNYPTPE
jgi:signal transduction histidine kinase